LADDRGLVPFGQADLADGLVRNWKDPVTGNERLRFDRGHIDKQTGLPYKEPRAMTGLFVAFLGELGILDVPPDPGRLDADHSRVPWMRPGPAFDASISATSAIVAGTSKRPADATGECWELSS
jgi:hypothetical protein